ncbi:uncharacterized protein LOC127812144 [Diospyros lotus]|uniref:uncharacterized protein LOC127812144 n=1 Tax=Diospyros lotus TaxID=55363 RepID=UPI002254FDF6|nr:uncharacterized protein LOC127812144 [Diospyros lotus]
MALKPLNKSLPAAVTPEIRPKKQTKVAVSIHRQRQPEDVGVNDENKAPPLVPPPADAAASACIDYYISSENLKALPDPEIKIQSLAEGLESRDWLRVCDSLNNARRLVLYHSSLLFPILEKVMLVLVKGMKNPRSALCKTSIMTASDIFNTFADKLLLESTTSDAFDHLLLQLLLKASQDKKFVCEEADRALNAMVGSMSPLALFHRLRAYVGHANPRVRAKAAISMAHCASNMGLEPMKEFGLPSMIQLASDLLNDRLPEAREAARSMVTSMYVALTENEEQKQETWQAFCQSNLPAIHAQSMVKLLSSQ